MQNDNSRETRRHFIRKSGLAIGVFASGTGILRAAESSAQYCPPDLPVNVDYPWNVCVNGAARASLYLIADATTFNPPPPSITLKQLLFDDLNVTLQGMLDRMPAPGTASYGNLLDAIQETKPANTIALLTTALTEARDAIVDPKVKRKKYVHFATTDPATWDPTVKTKLTALEDFITVPVLHVARSEASNLLNEYTVDLKEYGRNRTLQELFTKEHFKIDRSAAARKIGELGLWRKTRDTGLLWCVPRVGMQEFNNPNGRRCNHISGKCEPGVANDYCQEVDGTCNGMGT